MPGLVRGRDRVRGRSVRRVLHTVAVLLGTLAVFTPAAAQGQSVSVPPSGSTVGIPGPFTGPFGYFEGPYFPITWSCAYPWRLFFESNTNPLGWPAGSTDSVDAQFNPSWRTLLLIRGSRTDLPATGTITGRFECDMPTGKVVLPFGTTVTYAEGPDVPPPTGGPPAPPPGPTPAPAAPPAGPAAPGPASSSPPKSILNAKAKATLATAATRLRGYADNASALSRLCIVGSLKKEALKASLKVAAKDLAVSFVPILGDIPTDPCSAAMSTFIGLVLLEADGFDKLAADPPDNRYRTLARESVRFPVTFRGRGKAAEVAAALNDVVRNGARVSAYQAALLTSIERAQGANAAGQTSWEARQNTAARRFAAKAAQVLGESPAALRHLASALKAAGYGRAAPTLAQARALQADVTARGLPDGVMAMLKVQGVPAPAHAALRSAIQSAAPAELTRIGFPALLTDQRLAASMRSVATQLRALARG